MGILILIFYRILLVSRVAAAPPPNFRHDFFIFRPVGLPNYNNIFLRVHILLYNRTAINTRLEGVGRGVGEAFNVFKFYFFFFPIFYVYIIRCGAAGADDG